MAVELGAGHEQLSTTSTAGVKAGPVFLEELACPRSFGSRLAEDMELFGGQCLAPLGVSALAGVIRHGHH